jgi:PAS domain S-box-containing protein
MATILIVDDRPGNREYLVTLLGYGGHRLLEAADGAEALAASRAERPDLVIADILMPTMDGYEFVRQLRADPAVAATPVIFFTAHYHEREARALADACGVSHVLTKPAEPEVVLRTVDAALGAAPPPAPPPPAEAFDREHLRVLTDKLSEKTNELRSTNARLTALIDLGLELGSERDPQHLLQTFCHRAREIVGARYAVVGVLNGDGLSLRHVATSGMDLAAAARLGSPDPRQGVLGTVLDECRCCRRHNAGGDPDGLGLSPAFPPAHSFLGAPLVSPTRVYGWLCLLDKLGADDFSREDERLAGILAAQVGRVYENGSLYADVLRHAAELELEVGERKRAEEALRVQEAQFRSAFEDTNVAMVLTDLDNRFLRVNAAFARLFGYSEEEMLKLSMAGITHPDHLAESYARRQALLAGEGHFFQMEKRYLHKDGHAIWGLTNVALVRDPDGRPLLYVGQVQDITERKQSEAALAEHARLASLVADVGVALTHGDALHETLTRCAEAMVRHLGAAFARIWTVNEAQDVLELQASAGLYTHLDGPHSRVPVGQFKIGRIARERKPHLTNAVVGDPLIGDQEWARREGMVAFAGYPLLVADHLAGVMALFARQPLSDATLQAMAAVADQIALGIERKRAEEALRFAEQRLQHVVASSPAVLYTLAVEGKDLRITWISANVRELLGYAVADVFQPTWWNERVHPEDWQRTLAEVRADLFAHGRLAHEYRFRHRDGQYRWLRSEMRLLRDPAGNPVEVIGSWSDVTERKHLEDQFRQAQKMEAVGRLAGGVAHDFNNLITVITGYGELLLGTLSAGDPNRDLIREMVSAGSRAAGLTRQLLAFSRKAILEPRILDLGTLVTDMDKMLRRIIGEDILLTVTADPEAGAVKADPGQLEQVLLNLAVNARDAMPRGGRLTVEVRGADLDATYARDHPDARPGPHVLLAVTDTGCGMDAATLARIWEPFFTTKGERGTGLGLATVHGIVKQSGGHVAVYSEVGHGTTFKVYLPRVAQRPRAGKSHHGLTVLPRGRETVLLVEDEDGVRALTRHVLRECGYTVLEARDGAEAMRLAEQHAGRIDLLLTDVVMPRMGGREVAERVAALQPGVRILFLSGYTDDAVVRHGILEAEVAFLHKPFSPAALALKVREVLDGK